MTKTCRWPDCGGACQLGNNPETCPVCGDRVSNELRTRLMRKALEDLRDNGLRFDLNPTVCWKDEFSLHLAYTDYIKRMDERAREIGRAALGEND